jgi:hypothetical protein
MEDEDEDNAGGKMIRLDFGHSTRTARRVP